MNKNLENLKQGILKKKIYIILITFIFMITGISYTLVNVKYVASQKILVKETDKIETYQEMIKGSALLEKVIENLAMNKRVQDLSHLIVVDKSKDHTILTIQVIGENEQEIKQLSDEISNVFVEMVKDIYEDSEVYPIDNSANYAREGNVILVALISLVVGFVVSTLLFVVGFLLDIKIKSCKDIEEITGLKSLISIPHVKLIAKKKLTLRNIRAHKSEVFKVLMTNIQFVNSNDVQSKSILVTSPKSLTGKTYIATNLAIEFAKAGKKVILIDADMRRGRMAKIFSLPNDLGFSNYLSDLDSNGNRIHERITRFIHDTEIKNLSLITAGNVPPNPMELMKLEKVRQLIKDLKVFYDVVIFDTVSLLEAPETGELAKVCDLNLMLSSYGITKKEDLRKAYEIINTQSRACIGVGFNKVPDTRLKKQMVTFKMDAKKRWNKILKTGKMIFRNLGKALKLFGKIVSALKTVWLLIVAGLIVIKRGILKGMYLVKKGVFKLVHQLRSKSQDVKEYIQKYKTKKESVKLIESGSVPNLEENNIIRDVFENEMAKLEGDEVEYRKKLDVLKSNIEIRNVETPIVRPVIQKVETQEKSKFDLIREQQKKEVSEKQEKPVEVKEEEKEVEIKEKIIEFEAPEVKIQLEKIEPKQEVEEEKVKISVESYEEIDLSKQEHITEEMIRKQVEIDEMLRLAEKEEEEEAQRVRHMKIEKKMKKRKERKEQIMRFWDSIKNKKAESIIGDSEEERILKKEAKIQQKIQRENQRLEHKAQIRKTKEERKAYREFEKQRHKQELRIQEELQEDNLYPKPRI